MPNQKKRTAWSVQDVANGKATMPGSSPKFKSGYSGPKKASSRVMEQYNARSERSTGVMPIEEVNRRSSSSTRDDKHSSNRRRPSSRESMEQSRGYSSGSSANYMQGAGILDYAWILYSAILAICLTISLCVYSSGGSNRTGYTYPSYVLTMNGVLNSIHDNYVKNGRLGASANTEVASEDENVDTEGMLGEVDNTSALPNTTTGATMALDSGSTYGDYGMAASHDELITQLTKAFEANDFGFVGMKLAYTDEVTGELIGYPQSVVEHFTKYMSENMGKRQIFIDEIKDADTYSAKNGAAYLIKLPILKFTINMGYNNTNVSISGFSDQRMDAGQSAVVSPLLPCMYTITVTTDEGSQSSEVECDMSEGNLQINIGVTK